MLLVYASSLEEVITLDVIGLDGHLSIPRLPQVLPKFNRFVTVDGREGKLKNRVVKLTS